MSNVWIQFIVFAVALLFFCWLLLEYWFYWKGKSPEGGLYLASKAAFALSHFWKAVDGAKEIPEDTLKKEAGRTPLEAENEGSRPMHVREKRRFRYRKCVRQTDRDIHSDQDGQAGS